MAIVRLDRVRKTYALGKTEVAALRGVTVDIQRGDFISIAGPSGSGKTTILNLIGCIDTPTEGTVEIDGSVTSGLGDREITRLRQRKLGFIFQAFNLVPVLNVRENVELPLLLGGERAGRSERGAWIDHLVAQVGLDGRAKHRPSELSGGERQRVAIARALVTRPLVVLADEPTANLDSRTAEGIIELMKRMNRELGTTFVFSTHDARVVALADHVISLEDGLVASEERRERSYAAAR